MAALTEDRNTFKRDGELFNFAVAAGIKIFAGAIVMLNAAGYATKGATATGQIAVGRANEQVDNSAGADGDKSIDVEAGVFQFANSGGGDLIAITEIGDTCYIVDDQTVAKTDGTGTRSAAGTIVGVDSDGVWVRMGL